MAKKYIVVEKDGYTGIIIFGCISFSLYIVYQKLEPYFWICGIAVCMLLIIYCSFKMIIDCNVYGYIVFTIGVILSVLLSISIISEHYYPRPKPQIKYTKTTTKRNHNQKNSSDNKENISNIFQ